MAGKVLSDAELSDEVFSTFEGSDHENYSLNKNKTNLSKKVSPKLKGFLFSIQNVSAPKKAKISEKNVDETPKSVKKAKAKPDDRPVEEAYD